MQNSISLLNSEVILSYLGYESSYFNLNIFDSVDSTNTFLIDSFKHNTKPDFLNVIHVAAAEFQAKGRGRIGRNWYSGFSESLVFSIGWYFKDLVSSQLSSLSLVIGIAIIRVLKSISVQNINLKWPNDVVYNHHKLAGVLIELCGTKSANGCYAVIGIGINFNLSNSTRTNINTNVIDLFQITERLFDRNLILSALLIELKQVISDFEKLGFIYFKNEWMSYHAYQNKMVCLKMPNDQIVGIVDGVHVDGSILLLTESGRERFYIGDISLRDIS